MSYDIDKGYGIVPVVTKNGDLIGMVDCMRYSPSNVRDNMGKPVTDDSASPIMSMDKILVRGYNMVGSYAGGMLKSTSGDRDLTYALNRFIKALDKARRAVWDIREGKENPIALVIEDGDTWIGIETKLNSSFKAAARLRNDVHVRYFARKIMEGHAKSHGYKDIEESGLSIHSQAHVSALESSVEDISTPGESLFYSKRHRLCMDSITDAIKFIKERGFHDVMKMPAGDALWAALNDADAYDALMTTVIPFDHYYFGWTAPFDNRRDKASDYKEAVEADPEKYFKPLSKIFIKFVEHGGRDFIECFELMVGSGIPYEMISEQFPLPNTVGNAPEFIREVKRITKYRHTENSPYQYLLNATLSGEINLMSAKDIENIREVLTEKGLYTGIVKSQIEDLQDFCGVSRDKKGHATIAR